MNLQKINDHKLLSTKQLCYCCKLKVFIYVAILKIKSQIYEGSPTPGIGVQISKSSQDFTDFS